MEIVTRAARLRAVLHGARSLGRSVGLVPTMGALHAGHASLIERAAAECDLVVVSIFVNPLQFGEATDLDRYPRTLDTDLEGARASGASVVFAPSVEEMWPGWPEPRATSLVVGGVGSLWEGASRPGHFDGVATVVAKLFALAGPCRAYFGEKDYQQLCVVRRLVADLSFEVEVVGCPIVRDADGLALSSRNVLLGAEDRRAALALPEILSAGQAALDEGEPFLADQVARMGEQEPAVVARRMAGALAPGSPVVLDYAAVVDAEDLHVPERLDTERPLRLLVAASVGAVRLIDNAPALSVGALVPSAAAGATSR